MWSALLAMCGSNKNSFFQLLPFLELHCQGSWVVLLAVTEAGESSR